MFEARLAWQIVSLRWLLQELLQVPGVNVRSVGDLVGMSGRIRTTKSWPVLWGGGWQV